MRRVWGEVRVAHPCCGSAAQVQEDDATEEEAQGDVAGVSTKRLIRRRENLMRENPFCYWCDKGLVYFKMECHATMPDNLATLDHLNSKLMHPDGRPRMGRIVLSCPGCNQDRNRQEELALGVEELTRRAHKKHLINDLSVKNLVLT